MNNKVLERESSSTYFVISTIRDGVEKYISKNFFKKSSFQYTIKLNKAMMFRNHEMAERFIEYNHNNIDNPDKIKIYTVNYDKRISEFIGRMLNNA